MQLELQCQSQLVAYCDIGVCPASFMFAANAFVGELRTLNLEFNQLSGAVPTTVSTWTALTYVPFMA